MGWNETGNLRGPSGPPGEPGLVYRGAYSSTATYVPGDVVYHNYASWVARTTTTGSAPSTSNTTRWGQLTARGATGPAGPEGPKGAPGVDGSKWFTGILGPILSPPPGAKTGDMYLQTTTGYVYQYGDTTWTAVGNIRGPEGAPGGVPAFAVIECMTDYTAYTNTDTFMSSNYWHWIDSANGQGIITGEASTAGYGFYLRNPGWYRVSFNINGGRIDSNLSVKLTEGTRVVGGNTVFSWAGTSHESAVATSGLFWSPGATTYYPCTWQATSWRIIRQAFGNAHTKVAIEALSPPPAT